MSLMTLHCPECREERLFERPHDAAEYHDTPECPDRADSPDGLCPELACTECGTALLIGFALPITLGAPAVAAARRHRQERAA